MTQDAPGFLRIAIPAPLQRSFDYLPPAGVEIAELRSGTRVRVPFGRGQAVGVLLQCVTEAAVEAARLRRAIEILDDSPAVTEEILQLCLWSAGYYHHPIGEVVAAALPTLLRQGRSQRDSGVRHWSLTAAGHAIDIEQLRRSPRQAALLALLKRHEGGVDRARLDAHGDPWQAAMRTLIAKGWVVMEERSALLASASAFEHGPSLNADQQQAVDTLTGSLGEFQAFLLYGVTGSGKTEVYLRVIEQVLRQGKQALVLVPEIGLTPQLVERFRRRLQQPLVVLHSALSDRERLDAWLAARTGRAAVVIGTRSAVFTPLPEIGLIIVDEEHDLSYKQQDGLRYSARDLALIRARNAGIPVLLASATPSLESLYNAEQSRYRLLRLPERAGAALHPSMQLLDVRSRPMQDGLSELLLTRMRQHLDAGGQTLLFLNRRGFAPTLLCHDCGWIAQCRRCDARMTLHHAQQRLRCHHCGAERAIDSACPACDSADLRALGQGTERMEQALRQAFPEVGVVRIDRDSTRRKGEMQARLDSIHDGSNRILVGTQMLAKGHHFPDVTLVGVIDTDQGLFSADFRAGERMAQLVLQVAGRAGRADKPGEVLIQTHFPNHPLLQLLVQQDYYRFAAAALAERAEVGLPPFGCLALLRAEAPARDAPQQFLQQVAERAQAYRVRGVELLGPVAAPMERRQGRYRSQLLLQAAERADLHRLLAQLVPSLESLKQTRKVRWSLDVDPMDLM